MFVTRPSPYPHPPEMGERGFLKGQAHFTHLCGRIWMVGADRIVVGSDYNMDAGYPRPVEFVDTIPGLTTDERELILSGNAARVLRL